MTALDGRPVLKAGCRLSPAGDVLLIPEGALRLQGPARRIVDACDGTKTVVEIAAGLAEEYPDANREQIAEETAAFLRRLVERAVIEFV